MKEDWEIWNNIIDRLVDQGIENLGEDDQLIWRVNQFLFEIESGGLSGFLYNVSPADGEVYEWTALRQTVNAINRLGQNDVSQVLRDILSRVEIPDRATSTWEEFLEHADPEGSFEKVEEMVKQAIGPLYKKLSSFTAECYQAK